MTITEVRKYIRGLGGPGSGQVGHTTEHDAAVAAHAQAAATHKAALEAHTGAFHPGSAKTIGNQTSDLTRVTNNIRTPGDAKRVVNDIHTTLTSRGFTRHDGKSKNESLYGHKDGTVVQVKNQGKSGVIVQHIGKSSARPKEPVDPWPGSGTTAAD